MIDTNRIRKLLHEVASIKDQELPSGATKEDFDQLTRRTGITIPEELKEWLNISNAPYLWNGGFCGINTPENFSDIEYLFTLRPNWLSKGWIPVAKDGCGNYYIVPTRGELGEGFPVFFSDTYEDWDIPTYIVASSVGKFLEFALQEALDEAPLLRPHSTQKYVYTAPWPFNQAFVLAADPDIVRFRGINFPWNDNQKQRCPTDDD